MARKAKGQSGSQESCLSQAGGVKGEAGVRTGISRRTFFGSSAGLALAVSGFPYVLTSGRAKAEGGTVVVMAWENYVHAEIQKRFQAATGITVTRRPRGFRSGHVHEAEGRRRRPVRYCLRQCRLLSFLPRGRV